MRSFENILDIAADRKGGRAAVLSDIPAPKSAKDLAELPDSLWLAGMARGIFQAGISWTVVDKKWPDIEQAFHGFDVGRVAMMSEDWFYDLVADKRVIRSPPKIRAIQENAVFIQDVAAESGSFGQRVGSWPEDDFVGLLTWMQKRGARLGGNTGSYLLRTMGKDGFILSRDVLARLVAEGVIDKAPTSQKGKAAVQSAFNTWQDESGYSLTQISRVLAQSIG